MHSKRVSPWIGRSIATVKYPAIESQEVAIGQLGHLSESLIEHMTRMGKQAWFVRFVFSFASQSLLQFFLELLPIPFPRCMSVTVMTNEERAREIVVVVANSKRVGKLYETLSSCPCEIASECTECCVASRDLTALFGHSIQTTNL